MGKQQEEEKEWGSEEAQGTLLGRPDERRDGGLSGEWWREAEAGWAGRGRAKGIRLPRM